MITKIIDRRGEPAPIVTVAELRRRPGRFWKLADSRGTVVISRGDEPLAVALSLDQFVSLLFRIPARAPRNRRKSRKTKQKRR